jgi:thioredoxin 1
MNEVWMLVLRSTVNVSNKHPKHSQSLPHSSFAPSPISYTPLPYINLMAETKHAIEITDANFAEILAQGKPVLVDFWAEWCGPCLAVAPTIEELAKDFEGKAIIGKLNVDHNPEVSQKFNIMNIPTMLFFKGGEVQDKQVGAAPKATLKGKLDALVG